MNLGKITDIERAVLDSFELRDDYEPWVPENFVAVARALGISGDLQFMKHGSHAAVFDTGHDQVLKIRKVDDSTRIGSKFTLQPVFEVELGDEYSVLVSPKLTTEGEEMFHQKVLVYELWRDGYDFFDVMPPESNPRVIKNIRLVPGEYEGQYAGLPYVIDEGAVKRDKDVYNRGYIVGEDGRRTEEDFIAENKNRWRDNRIPAQILERVLAHDFDWPDSQWDIFPRSIITPTRINYSLLGLCVLEADKHQGKKERGFER